VKRRSEDGRKGKSWRGQKLSMEAFPGKALIRKIVDNDEVLGWYELNPQERFAESQKLWEIFDLFGGSYDVQPDTQSPFNIFKT